MSSHKFFTVGCAALALVGGAGMASGSVYAAEGAEKTAGFEDSTFYTCVTKAAGVEASTVLTDAQLSAIETVNCGATSGENSKIKSLTGLEKLTGIKNLVLTDRGIEGKIDFGKNPELKSLDISGNWFSAIDLSKNAKLESLIAKESGLSDLDVSKNPQLKNLVIKGIPSIEAGLKGSVSASGKIVYDYSNIKFLRNDQGSSVKHIMDVPDCATNDEENHKLIFSSQSCLDSKNGITLDIAIDDGAGSASKDEYKYFVWIANEFSVTFVYYKPNRKADDFGAAYTIYHNDVTRSAKKYSFTLPDGFAPLSDEDYKDFKNSYAIIKGIKDAGYKFLGWTDVEDGKVVKYKAGSKFETAYEEGVSYAYELYPVWDNSNVKKSSADVKNPNTADGIAVSAVAAVMAAGGVALAAIKNSRRR